MDDRGFDWTHDPSEDAYVERQTGLRISSYHLRNIGGKDPLETLNHIAIIILQERLKQKMKDTKPHFYDDPTLLLLEETTCS